jgi:hypothetical protein
VQIHFVIQGTLALPRALALGGNKHHLQPWCLGVQLGLLIDTLWLFNIAMENGPFIDGLPIKNGDFPWLC